MSFEVHVTRGEGFGERGVDPITLDAWRRLVAETAGAAWADATRFGPHSATLAGMTLRWSDGVVSVVSPRDRAALARLCAALDARMFGEDGVELGGDEHDEVRRTLARGFPKVDAASLGSALSRLLVRVTDPMVPVTARREARAAVVAASGAAGAAALAYLACRAVECGGEPLDEVTDAAASLLHWDPSLLDGLRAPPTERWVALVHERAKTTATTGEPRVVVCACGQQNRVPANIPAGKRARCGQCKAPLPA